MGAATSKPEKIATDKIIFGIRYDLHGENFV
jgi:hypothetical protein